MNKKTSLHTTGMVKLRLSECEVSLSWSDVFPYNLKYCRRGEGIFAYMDRPPALFYTLIYFISWHLSISWMKNHTIIKDIFLNKHHQYWFVYLNVSNSDVSNILWSVRNIYNLVVGKAVRYNIHVLMCNVQLRPIFKKPILKQPDSYCL